MVSCAQCTRCNVTVLLSFVLTLGLGTCDLLQPSLPPTRHMWYAKAVKSLAIVIDGAAKAVKSLAKFQDFVALQTQPEHVA